MSTPGPKAKWFNFREVCLFVCFVPQAHFNPQERGACGVPVVRTGVGSGTWLLPLRPRPFSSWCPSVPPCHLPFLATQPTPCPEQVRTLLDSFAPLLGLKVFSSDLSLQESGQEGWRGQLHLPRVQLSRLASETARPSQVAPAHVSEGSPCGSDSGVASLRWLYTNRVSLTRTRASCGRLSPWKCVC